MAQNELHLKVTLRIYSDDAGAPLPPGRSRLYGNGLLQGVAYHPHG